jgi:hypothetical protein
MYKDDIRYLFLHSTEYFVQEELKEFITETLTGRTDVYFVTMLQVSTLYIHTVSKKIPPSLRKVETTAWVSRPKRLPNYQ